MELSIRGYGQHRGVSEAAVRKAIKQGRITKKKNGKIDPKIADDEWQKNTDPAQIKIVKTSKSTKKETSFQESRALKEAYSAKLLKLQFERESGKLIPVAEVKTAFFNASRSVRDRILHIPDRVIPNLIGKTDIFEMKEILKVELNKALEELFKSYGDRKHPTKSK